MTACLKCGIENKNYICDSCKQYCDIEGLCNEIISYNIKSGNNEIWNSIINGLDNPYKFKSIVVTLSKDLTTPRKEYIEICYLSGNSAHVPKDNRERLLELYLNIINSNELKQDEKNKIRGWAMAAYVAEYRYADAERIAYELSQYDQLPYQTCHVLGDFYIKTRRYDIADKTLNDGLCLYKDSSEMCLEISGLLEDSQKRRNGEKKEYMPKDKQAKLKYIDFLTSIGIEVKLPSSVPEPIPENEYPIPVEFMNPYFDSFIAFDLETTGFSPEKDSIIEIGAIKVVNGEVIESNEFIFREFVKPFKSKITPKITEITGITEEDVKEAREMWEVMFDFLDFAGDFPLVGFNSARFDIGFLVRAGRYSNRIITNQHFDVWRYANNFKNILKLKNKSNLGLVSNRLGIENPSAHRALADAITTAKVFLKLREIDNKSMVM